MIKAIAFAGVGVLLRKNSAELSPLEQTLEAKFGYYNLDDEYYDWAIKKTKMNREALELTVEDIIMKSYDYTALDLRLDFPDQRLLLVCNQLTALRKYLHFNDIEKDFDDVLISAEVEAEKPSLAFFDLLLEATGCSVSEVLLVDDDPASILAAKQLGMPVLHFRGGDYATLLRQVREKLS